MENQELTFGQKAVGVTFNPSQNQAAMKKPIFNQIERWALRYYFEHKNEIKNTPLIVLEWYYYKLKQALAYRKMKFLKIFK